MNLPPHLKHTPLEVEAAMTRREAIDWLLAHEDDESVDEKALREAVRTVLGREATAEDWDRIPEIVREVEA